MIGYDPFRGQTILTNANGVECNRKQIAQFQIIGASAVASSSTAVHSAVTLGTSAQDVTTNITNPSTPRCIRVVGNASGITGNVVLTGTNFNGDAITSTIALNGTTPVDGTKAFKTITKITLPAKTNSSGDTVSVGFNEVLGLPYLLSHNTVEKAFLNNVLEATAPTVTTSATSLELNTIKLNSTLNGTDVDIYLIV